ncbi:GNAT family N-acetyltransferase [Plantibacter sp. Mn2098]|uniref:GNAT family N-acetyltransferase n=1 Tax=Plantibacter sp. Mn2098 TaxID=3395266 RepID=UPI003BCAEA12
MSEHNGTLSQRVHAPDTVTIPSHPDIATWRPATTDDIEILLELHLAIGPVDHPEFVVSREDVADDFADESIDMALDSLLGFTADGVLVANAEVSLHPDHSTRIQSHIGGGVHPEWRGRGIGSVLLEWAQQRSQQQLASLDLDLPGWSMGYVDERNADGKQLFADAGFRVARYFTHMQRVLADEIPVLPSPAGLRVIGYTPEYSDRTRRARNDSFRDHWGSLATPAERWEQFVGGPRFRNDLSIIAVDENDDVVGFVLTEVDEEDWAAQGFTGGYIALVGIVRSARGKRLAPVMLSEALRRQQSAGYERATLEVDTESPTGALGLYERIGFTATTREVAFVREY